MNLNLEDEEEVVDPITLKSALYAAAKDDDPRTVMDLLEKKVPTTYVDESGWTALHWAAKNGNAKMVRALLDHHASDPYHFVKAEAAGKSFLQRAKAPLSEEKRSEASETNADLSEVESREAFEATLRRRALEDMGTDLSDNFVKNTPLLWACFKGHLYIVWMLLLDGYSPNDRDDMGNTSLHLAAAAGVVKVVELLIQDGVSANIVNIYKNLPIDTTTDSSIREMLVVAMTKFASMTAEESALKHEANMNAYKSMRKRLSDTLDLLNSSVASEGCCGTLNEDSCLRASERHLRDLNAVLSEAKVWRIDDDLIDQGDAWVARLEVTHELLRMLSLTRAAMPIKTQADFVQYIHTLERGIRRAERGAGNTQVVEAAKTLISHAQIEFWLQGIVARLKGVEVAAEEHEHDILKLGAAIEKAKLLSAGSVLLDGAVVLHARLVAELEGSRSLQSVPTVRLPMENPPEGYYQPSDKGKIIETAGHPLPPEGGVYQWEQSASFAALSKAMDRMRAVLNNVDGTGINMTLVSQLKEKLFRAEKDYKQLEIKENNDKQLAVDLATKQAKKLKKRSKGLKKKK